MLKANREVVKVVWRDATSEDDWLFIDDLKTKQPKIMCSVGYRMVNTDSCLIITSTLCDEDDSCGGYLCIPKENIINCSVIAKPELQVSEAHTHSRS